MALIGYARVSTLDQNLDLQIRALEEAGASKIFSDHGVSGTLASRPQLDEALKYVRDGDVLACWKLDRIGRSTKNVLALLEDLHERGVGFRSLTEGLDTSGAMGKAMITVLAAFNELERDVIVERTRAGLGAARARGRVGGRPRVDSKKIASAIKLYDTGDHTVREIAGMLGLGEATIYRYLASSATSRTANSVAPTVGRV
jgi:DNA invertase Pin-like site-specific DNA recombinase